MTFFIADNDYAMIVGLSMHKERLSGLRVREMAEAITLAIGGE